jgi:hypothetical protein
MFCYKFIAACSTYNKGKMTQNKVFEALKLLYRTEQATGNQTNLMPSKHEITMLTTNLAKANVELYKMKSLGGGGGRGGGTRRGNNNCGAEKGGGGGNNAAMSHAWMLARTTNNIKHPSQGYGMKWCKLCGPGHTKGIFAGMYMQAPHDHAIWLLFKKEMLAKFNAKKKSLKAKKSKAGDDNDSTDNKVKSIKLSDSIINSLTTEIMIGGWQGPQDGQTLVSKC